MIIKKEGEERNVITAIGNPHINEELKKDNFYYVMGVDIQYQDGIFEILEENKNINYLILNINLLGELNEKDLIEKIMEKNNKLKLIIILEKENEKLISYLLSKNINNILIKNKNNLIEINNIIKNKKEINIFDENKKNNLIKNKIIIKNKLNKINKKKSKIIIFGNKKINKNNLIILFLKIINKKTLIIELINVFNNKKSEEKEQTIKLNKKIDLINCNIESLNRRDLKNNFNNYNYIIFNLFNIKNKEEIINIINIIF